MPRLTVEEHKVVGQAILNLSIPCDVRKYLIIEALRALERNAKFRPGCPPGSSLSKIGQVSAEKRGKLEVAGNLFWTVYTEKYVREEVVRLGSSREAQACSAECELVGDVLSRGPVLGSLSSMATENNDENANEKDLVCNLMVLIGMGLEKSSANRVSLINWMEGLVESTIEALITAYDFFKEAEKMSSTIQLKKELDYEAVAAALNKGLKK